MDSRLSGWLQPLPGVKSKRKRDSSIRLSDLNDLESQPNGTNEQFNQALSNYIQVNASINANWFQQPEGSALQSSSSNSMLLNSNPEMMRSSTDRLQQFTVSNDEVTSTTPSLINYANQRSPTPSTLLIATKHICAICGDRASGKHYGVYSCEGCKGFFKRTVRKDLAYLCREMRNCIIDKRQRNRCQYCRYRKCENMGMKREAVQEERQSARCNDAYKISETRQSSANQVEPESTSMFGAEMPIECIVGAEEASEALLNNIKIESNDFNSFESIEWQMMRIIDWALMMPSFTEIPLDEQSRMIHSGWCELILADVAFRSSADKLIVWPEHTVERDEAESRGAQTLFARILTELTAKMREIGVDRMELGALRCIVLFNPEITNERCRSQVEQQREKVYRCLEEHCRQQYPQQSQRFAKLLLRLPALRSLSLKCIECNQFIVSAPNIQDLLRMLILRQKAQTKL